MFEQIRVHDWMTTPAITVLPNTPLITAREIMKSHNVRRLIVAEHGRLLGILTSGDLREASPSDATSLSIWELNHLWSQLTVDDVMTRSTITISPDDPIVDAAATMLEHKISGLPVIDRYGALVGVITEIDIFRLLVETDKAKPKPMATVS